MMSLALERLALTSLLFWLDFNPTYLWLIRYHSSGRCNPSAQVGRISFKPLIRTVGWPENSSDRWKRIRGRYQPIRCEQEANHAGRRANLYNRLTLLPVGRSKSALQTMDPLKTAAPVVRCQADHVSRLAGITSGSPGRCVESGTHRRLTRYGIIPMTILILLPISRISMANRQTQCSFANRDRGIRIINFWNRLDANLPLLDFQDVNTRSGLQT